MLIEIFIALIIGVGAGTLTGLIPGIHINLIGAFLISLSASLLFSINPIYIAIFIVGMAITHSFIDFIPSIFLGCPDTDTELSILPGHELLKKGLGYEAILLTCYGSLAAIFMLFLIAIPFLIFKEGFFNIYPLIKKIIPFLLIAVSIILILLEKKKLTALFAFLMAGLLGWSVLNIQQINQPILPLLTGLFGVSILIMSIKTKMQIPKQKITKSKTKLFKPVIGALIASPICSFLPGLGSGQAAILGNIISRTDRKGFLVLLGTTNTIVMSFSFVSLYLISRTRTGAAVALQKILGEFSLKILVLILTTSLISGVIAFFLTIYLAKFFSKRITKMNYTILSSITLGILVIIVFLVSNFLGLIILAVSALTGIYCISLGVRRTNMMGCLLIPTIIFYLF